MSPVFNDQAAMTLDHNDVDGSLHVSGILHIQDPKQLQEKLCHYLDRQSDIAINLGVVEACDTASLQILVAGRETAAALGKALCFAAISETVAQSASAIGLTLVASSAVSAGEGVPAQ